MSAPGAGTLPQKAAFSVLEAEALVVGPRDPVAPRVGPVNLRLGAGEVLCLRGPSGAGKSTLLAALALLQRPRTGALRLWGEEVGGASDAVRARLRRRRLGIVQQGGNLVPALHVAGTVTLQARLAGDVIDGARLQLALAALELTALAKRPAHALIGGEAARVAVARVLYQAPALVVADEPTAALDPARVEAVAAALSQLRAAGSCVVVATHDAELARRLLQDSSGRGTELALAAATEAA